MRARTVLVAAAVALLATACHRPKHYDANVQVARISVVSKDETGKPITVDFEYSFFECPGTQIEVIRGDAAFAACVAKYKVGDKLNVSLDHQWNPEGHWEWVVRQVGDCTRVPDPNDEASFALVRECEDWVVNGSRVGFQCRYKPEKALVDKCPWFRRH